MKTRPTTVISLLIALLTICCLSLPAVADEERTFRTELGVQGGFFLPDQDLVGDDNEIEQLEPTGGIRFDLLFAKRFGWFVDGLTADMNTRSDLGDSETNSFRTGIEIFTKPYWKKLAWFFELGGGNVDFDIEASAADLGIGFNPDFDRNYASLAIGQRVMLDHRARLRWSVRVDQAFDDDDLVEGEDITRGQFLVGVSWGLGHDRRDSDGDGVIDRKDKCPGTPKGAVVDEHGCPKDTDGDGVYDGIDKCPGTPRGAIVDEWGCPKDSDGDGVYDGLDKCPNTPKGVPVNPDGCPKAAPLFEEGRETLILEGVFFEFDKDVLTHDSSATLDRVAQSLKAWPEVRVEIAGHTDWIGSDAYNLDLSARRAKSVREYLLGKGIAADRMTSNGYGEARPIADNQTDEGRATNRRVELNKLN